MTFSTKNVLMEAGKVFVAPFDPTTSTIPTLTASNRDTIVTFIEANYIFSRLGGFRDLKLIHDVSGKRKTLQVDDCDIGIFSEITTLTPRVEGEWVDCDDLDVVATVTGLTVQNVAASAVPVTAEPHGTGWTQGNPIKLDNKNGNNTVVGSIVVKGGASTLALNTDYRVYLSDGTDGDYGYTYITPITAQASAITVDYSYTPNAGKYLAYNIASQEVPFLIVKIVGCPDGDGEYNTYYLVKSAIDKELSQNFVNLSRVDDVKGSDISFLGSLGGMFIEKKEKL